jgi:hypothetical protein
MVVKMRSIVEIKLLKYPKYNKISDFSPHNEWYLKVSLLKKFSLENFLPFYIINSSIGENQSSIRVMKIKR